MEIFTHTHRQADGIIAIEITVVKQGKNIENWSEPRFTFLREHIQCCLWQPVAALEKPKGHKTLISTQIDPKLQDCVIHWVLYSMVNRILQKCGSQKVTRKTEQGTWGTASLQGMNVEFQPSGFSLSVWDNFKINQ